MIWARPDSETWSVRESSLLAYAGPSTCAKVLAEFRFGDQVSGTTVMLSGHKWLELDDIRGPRFIPFDGAELAKLPSRQHDEAIMRLDAARRVFSLEEGLRLQHELIRHYMSGDFQRSLWQMYEGVDGRNPDKEMSWLHARQLTLLQEHVQVIEKFGFPPNPQGFQESLRAFTPQLRSHPQIAENRLLIAYLTDPGMQTDVSFDRVPAPRGALRSRLKCPNPEEWMRDSSCKVWLVVGGADRGGILVRKSQDTSSPICCSRLAVGSLVEEVDRYDNRIKYLLMDGSGPDIGWVSVTYAFKALLTPAFSDAQQQEVLENKEYFQVVHERVAQRMDPDLKSIAVGLKFKNDIVKGLVIKVGDVEWLQIRGRRGLCFMLIDGSTFGLSALMRRVTKAEQAEKEERETEADMGTATDGETEAEAGREMGADAVQVRSVERRKVVLTLEEILKMHERLIIDYMSEEFQRAIWEAFNDYENDSHIDGSELAWVRAKMRVCSQVQYPVLKEFGFEESYKGVLRSMKAVPSELRTHPRIAENRLLMRYLVDPPFQLEVMDGWKRAPQGVPRARIQNPRPDDWIAGSGKIWIVVGGEDKGGITVRKDQGVDSSVLSLKLATNSMVEQLERVEARIKYFLMLGSGPKTGWISIARGEKLLLAPAHASLASRSAKALQEWSVVHDRVAQRAEPSMDSERVGMLRKNTRVKGAVIEKDGVQWLEVYSPSGLSYLLINGASVGLGTLLQKVKLSLDDAIEMLNRLIQGYMSEGFQQLIWQEYFRCGRDPEAELEWLKAKDAACQSVLFPILEEFGFQTSRRGMRASTLAITPQLREFPPVRERILLRRYLLDPRMQEDVALEKIPVPRGVPRSRVLRPFPDDWDQGTGKIWIVVGGAAVGGISVKDDASHDSTLLTQKLAHNSLIEELERQGSRLKYWRMDGSGPDIGWVSISAEGKALLQPYLGNGGLEAPTKTLRIVGGKGGS